MDISILSVFPEIYDSFLSTSLLKRAQENKILSFKLESFFSFVAPKERIDAPPFGPGTGMLIKPEVVQKAIEHQEAQYGKAFKIFFSPQGKKLNQKSLQRLADKLVDHTHLMMIASRYEGMDTRVEQVYADEIISVGDFVVMGGDVPAMLLLEGLVRLIPGVVGKQESVERDSFFGPFVDYPEYTQPVEWQGRKVPDIVRSGNHGAIEHWRNDEAVKTSVLHHFDWVRSYRLSDEQKTAVKKVLPAHYCALLHDEVLLPDGRVGTSSVTSLDIHDVARSGRTFGIKNYYMITTLADQKKIVQRFLDFWKSDVGIDYNPHRHEAVGLIRVVDSLDEAIAAIERQEGKRPVVIATSAQKQGFDKEITYFDQERVWAADRPVLLIFGTAQGLAPQVLERCDFVLVPVEGFTDYNHLSVRSAVAIIFDRWLGINIRN